MQRSHKNTKTKTETGSQVPPLGSGPHPLPWQPVSQRVLPSEPTQSSSQPGAYMVKRKLENVMSQSFPISILACFSFGSALKAATYLSTSSGSSDNCFKSFPIFTTELAHCLHCLNNIGIANTYYTVSVITSTPQIMGHCRILSPTIGASKRPDSL